MTDRAFENTFPEYSGEKILTKEGLVKNELEKKLDENIELLLKKLEKALEKECDWGDLTVYTGTTGYGLLYFHLYLTLGLGLDEDGTSLPTQDPYFRKALFYVERQLKDMKRKRVTFLCGDPGPLALGAVLYHKMGKKQDTDMCVKRLVSRTADVLDDDSLPSELLFGRAGFLWALLFVQKHLGADIFDAAIIPKLFKAIIQAGQTSAQSNGFKEPLMYEWHDKGYLGAAHGYVGIFTTLLQINDDQYDDYLRKFVHPMIDYLMTFKLPSGNYPSSVGSTSGDKLVHWCHGAPGWVYMYLAAHKRFGDGKYLKAAKDCCDVIWERGLLKKGYGLCHGTAGNAYAFLALFKATHKEEYLYKAIKFAEWCMDYGKHDVSTPDRPWSLFEGLAGTIYFLADLIDPMNAKFPALEL